VKAEDKGRREDGTIGESTSELEADKGRRRWTRGAVRGSGRERGGSSGGQVRASVGRRERRNRKRKERGKWGDILMEMMCGCGKDASKGRGRAREGGPTCRRSSSRAWSRTERWGSNGVDFF
jgi:hypothetical protein